MSLIDLLGGTSSAYPVIFPSPEEKIKGDSAQNKQFSRPKGRGPHTPASICETLTRRSTYCFAFAVASSTVISHRLPESPSTAIVLPSVTALTMRRPVEVMQTSSAC